MDRKLTFALIYISVILLGYWLFAVAPTWTGIETQLRLVPVDPIDFFHGDYMDLRYEITAPNSTIPIDEQFYYGQPVYVALSSDSVAKPLRLSHQKPDGFFIRGTVTGLQNERIMTAPLETDKLIPEKYSPDTMPIITYGIERFFIPEGSGKKFQIDGTFTARVMIDGRGTPRVLELLQNGVPVSFTYTPVDDR